jgi:hypothetical protein
MKKIKTLQESIALLESEISVAKTQGNTRKVKTLTMALARLKRELTKKK